MAGPAEEAGRRGCGDRSRDDGGVAAMGQRSIGGRTRGETEVEDRRLISRLDVVVRARARAEGKVMGGRHWRGNEQLTAPG